MITYLTKLKRKKETILKNEIELRSLITKLELKDQDIQPYSLALQKELNLIPRKFGITKKWSKIGRASCRERV